MPPKVPKTFFLDGVCLSEIGLNQIREMSLRFAEKKQKPRWRRNPSASIHPALLMMMSEKMLEDDPENADSKTAMMGSYQTAMACHHYDMNCISGLAGFLEYIFWFFLYSLVLVLLLLLRKKAVCQ